MPRYNLASKIESYKQNFQWLDFSSQSILVLMGAFIFLNPFPHTQTIGDIVFYLSVFIIIILMIFKKVKLEFNTPMTLPFGLYALWAFLGLFFALDKLDSIRDFHSHLLKYLMLYYILINYFSSKKLLHVLSWTIILSAAIFSTVPLFYFYVLLGQPLTERFGIIFPYMATNVIGYTTVFASLLSFHHLRLEKRLFQRVILSISFLSVFAASILSQSRGTLLAIMLSFFIIMKNKKLYVFIFIVLTVCVLLTPLKYRLVNPANYHDRLFPAYFSLEIIKDYPIMGVGYSIDALKNPAIIDPVKYKARIPEKYRSEEYVFILPHSMFLNIPVRLGLVGLGFFLYILFVFCKMSWMLIKNGRDEFIKSWGVVAFSAFIMVVVKGAFEPIDTHTVQGIFFTIFSMLTILWRLNEEGAHPVS